MKVITLHLDDNAKVYCPFCGVLTFDSQQEELVDVTCPHLLFTAYTGGDNIFSLLREDIADEYGESIDPNLYGEADSCETADGEQISVDDDEYDDNAPMPIYAQVLRAKIPHSVCFEFEKTFFPPIGASGNSIYIGFCRDKTIRNDNEE